MGTSPPTVRETLVALAVVPLYVVAVYAALYAKDAWIPAHPLAAVAVWSLWCAAVWRAVRRMEPNFFRTIGVLAAAIPLAILATGMVGRDAIPVGPSWGRVVVAGVVAGLVALAMQWRLSRLDARRGRPTPRWTWPAPPWE